MVGDADLQASLSSPESCAELFDACGVCWFDAVLPTELIDQCKASYEARRGEIDKRLEERGVDLHDQFRFNEICRRRFMRYDVRGYGISAVPFQDPRLHHLAPWLPFVKSVLGVDACERWRGIVDNRPGSEMQGWHRDGDHLFNHMHLPAHCVTIFVPLVDVQSEECGPTQFYPGSHVLQRAAQYVGLSNSQSGTEDDFNSQCIHVPHCTPMFDRGGALAFDYRVIHRASRHAQCKPGRQALLLRGLLQALVL